MCTAWGARAVRAAVVGRVGVAHAAVVHSIRAVGDAQAVMAQIGAFADAALVVHGPAARDTAAVVAAVVGRVRVAHAAVVDSALPCAPRNSKSGHQLVRNS